MSSLWLTSISLPFVINSFWKTFSTDWPLKFLFSFYFPSFFLVFVSRSLSSLTLIFESYYLCFILLLITLLLFSLPISLSRHRLTISGISVFNSSNLEYNSSCSSCLSRIRFYMILIEEYNLSRKTVVILLLDSVPFMDNTVKVTPITNTGLNPITVVSTSCLF